MFRPLSPGTWTECVLALSTLHIWISCSCKPGAKWETWRATVSWVGTPQETKCTQFLALPVEIRLLLLFVAHFFFFFSVTFFVSLTSARHSTVYLPKHCWVSLNRYKVSCQSFKFFWRISVKISFALFASTGDCRTCGYDKNFPTLQIVKDNQTLAQREVQRSKGFLLMRSQLAEPLHNVQCAILKNPDSLLSHSVLFHAPGHKEILPTLFLLPDYGLLSLLQPWYGRNSLSKIE